MVCFVALASARLCLASICFATFACAFLAIAARLRFAASRRALRSLHRSARVMPTPRTALMSCAAAKTIPARRNTVSHGTPIKASRHAIALVSSLARPACLLTNRTRRARGTRARACGETSDGCWFKRLLIDGEVLLAGPLKIHLYLSIVTVRVARATR